VDEDKGSHEAQFGLVGVPLSILENANDFNLDNGIPMVGPYFFMQWIDANTNGALS
jgi:hypothetical protein